MSLIASLLVLQAAPIAGEVHERSPELNAANDCLVAETRQWLEDKNRTPDAEQRWRWARVVVARCDDKVRASVPAHPTSSEMSSQFRREGAVVAISRHQLRESEALYYVDGMIREHFEEAE